MLITGGDGQLGVALAEVFPDAVAVTRDEWDITLPPPPHIADREHDLVLHTAGWTDVDGAEDDPQGAASVNVGGTAHVASLGAPVVYISTDYVFDGTKREPYVESDSPHALSAYGRTKLHGEAAAASWHGSRAVRPVRLTSKNFVRTMLRPGRERGKLAVVGDQQLAPTYVGHLADAMHPLELPYGVYHVASDDCTWAEFGEAIFEKPVSAAVSRRSGRQWGAKAMCDVFGAPQREARTPHLHTGASACAPASSASIPRTPGRRAASRRQGFPVRTY